MAKRRSWLIAYDIADPGRLRRVHRLVAARAHPLQYSVFAADLTERQLAALSRRLEKLIDPGEDDVRFYPVPAGARPELAGKRRLPEGAHLFGSGAARLAAAGGAAGPAGGAGRRRRCAGKRLASGGRSATLGLAPAGRLGRYGTGTDS